MFYDILETQIYKNRFDITLLISLFYDSLYIILHYI